MRRADESLSFTVPGPPLPWMRAASRRGQRFTPKEQRAYQDKVRLCALAAGARRMEGLLELSVVAYLPDRRRRDWDNLGKQVADALNGCAYEDDSQIWAASVVKLLDGVRPRMEVTLRRLSPERAPLSPGRCRGCDDVTCRACGGRAA